MFITSHLDYLALLFLRMASLLFVSQLFGRNNIPVVTKVGLSIMLTYIAYLWAPPVALTYQTIWGFAGLCIGEALIGVVLGIVTNTVFTLTYTAGYIIDMQLGFSMVNIYDPLSNTQIPIMGNALNLLLVLLFFQVNGHLRLMQMLINSVVRLPVGQVHFSPALTGIFIELFCQSIVLAINVAMPVLAASLVIEIAMGVIIRTAPQMNMFVVGIPLKLLVGLMIVVVTIPVFGKFSEEIITVMFRYMDSFFASMLPA